MNGPRSHHDEGLLHSIRRIGKDLTDVLVFFGFSLNITDLLCDGLKGVLVIRVLRLQLWILKISKGSKKSSSRHVPCCFLAETCCDI